MSRKTKEKIIKEYIRKYSKKPQYIENKFNKNKVLIDKWILGKPKNPYYPYPNESDIIEKGDLEYYALLDWTIPATNYKYRMYNMKDKQDYSNYCSSKNVIRSSIIPVVKINGENYWLLGSFHDYKDPENLILADFGGKCEEKDEKQINFLSLIKEDEIISFIKCKALNCALRELREETRDVLTDDIKKAIDIPDNIVIFEGMKNNKKIYFMFVFLNYEDVKDISKKFIETKEERGEKGEKGEKLGNINFYKQKDIKSRKYKTARDLTDFVTYLKNISINI